MERNKLEVLLKDLFRQQMLGVLATSGAAGPYVSLVAFAVTEDLRRLVFITSRSTRKFTNITASSNVSLAVTLIGHTMEAQGRQKSELLPLFLSKHPDLETFSFDPSFALMTILVDRYVAVLGFADVTEITI